MVSFYPRKKGLLKGFDQVTFLAELAELTAAGQAMPTALEILALAHPNWAEQLGRVQQQLAAGQPLSTALRVCLPVQVATYLDLGEGNGRFEETLQLLASHLTLLLSYRRRLKQVLTYPAVLLVCLLGLVALLECFLYPAFADLLGPALQMTGQNQALISLHWLAGACLFLALLLLATVIWLRRLAPLQQLRWLGRLPLLRPFTKALVSQLLAAQLGLLLSAGLPLPVILRRFAKEKGTRQNFAAALAQSALVAAAAGQPLADWVRRQSFLNPILAGYLLRGGADQHLGASLTYFAQNEGRHFRRLLNRALAWVQPICFALIGLTIVLLYLAMLLPLYQHLGDLNG
ncbi:type II secretion system F family protein [Leuconostocaceae bacterium ESL0958]|nr:type II secretion system F family protein [Leuconostocaceae bacterium ESL0958]